MYQCETNNKGKKYHEQFAMPSLISRRFIILSILDTFVQNVQYIGKIGKLDDKDENEKWHFPFRKKVESFSNENGRPLPFITVKNFSFHSYILTDFILFCLFSFVLTYFVFIKSFSNNALNLLKFNFC